jgi:hypothetical protein
MIYLVPSIFPLVAGILNVIAARNIMLDEAMVQSVAIRQELSKRRRKAKK